MTEQTPDTLFQATREALASVPGVLWTPCRGGYSDYRYRACYVDESGTLPLTFKRVLQQLQGAGFTLSSTGSLDTEFSATLANKAPATTLDVRYVADELSLLMLQPDTGMFGTPPGTDPRAGDSDYTRLDRDGVAKHFLYGLLMDGEMPLRRISRTVVACPAPQTGVLCAQAAWTEADLGNALTNFYFGGNAQLFRKLNAQPTFTHTMAAGPGLEGLDVVLPLVRKTGPNTYQVRDEGAYRGRTITVKLEAGGLIQVTAK